MHPMFLIEDRTTVCSIIYGKPCINNICPRFLYSHYYGVNIIEHSLWLFWQRLVYQGTKSPLLGTNVGHTWTARNVIYSMDVKWITVNSHDYAFTLTYSINIKIYGSTWFVCCTVMRDEGSVLNLWKLNISSLYMFYEMFLSTHA